MRSMGSHKDPVFLHVDSDDSDQIGRMSMLIWVFTGCTGHFVGFAMQQLIHLSQWKEMYR